GEPKVEVMKKRLLDINPELEVELHKSFYLPDNHDEYRFEEYDYVIDCIDTVAAKIDIVLEAQKSGTPVISSMGTGNKLNPSLLEISDIYKTSVCPLARVMRYELKKRGVKKLKVVYSTEKPIKVSAPLEDNARRCIPGSVSFVPASAGLLIASEVVRDLIA
ncbi:MAG: tRNA threonylcarbamoyladenosine dehydratase, partial [Lachnospira sp.]|nr:tRNA threonylcarbamoyladenosine dehydratase [Lachnospira sp.]